MFSLNCKGRLFTITKPIVMGILNVTADSFFAGSRHQQIDSLLRSADNMLTAGATILDVGAQSTRPGSTQLTAEEELANAIPAIEALHKNFPQAFISIDTYYHRVAKEAIYTGASIVNDISAGQMDEKMIDTVALLQVPYILMHMKGSPQTMQQHTQYKEVTLEVLDFFIQKIQVLHNKGIHDIIIDPGIGFSKTITQNFNLLKKLEAFKILGRPLLLGVSRKGFIYKTLGTDADHALNGTSVMHTIGLMNGASVLRVHDVKEAIEAIKLIAIYLSIDCG